jgi:hypothetical protein
VLVEESRTNLELYSDDLTNAVWGKANASVSVVLNKISPRGFQAQKLVENLVNGLHYLGTQPAGTTDNVAYSWTRYVAPGERTWCCLEVIDRANTFRYASFNLVTGVWGLISTGLTCKAIKVDGGWYRLEISIAASTGSTNARCTVFLALGDGSGANINYQGDGVSGLYLGHFQCEIGASSTSSIPTTATAVNRPTDVLTTSNINWFKSPTGTFYFEGDCQFVNSSAIMLTLASSLGGSANCTPQFDILADGRVRAYFSGTAIDSPASTAKVTLGTKFKAAVAFNATTISIAVNGVVATAARTSVAAPTAFQIGCGGVSQALNGHIANVKHYQRKFSDQELIQLTT